MCNVEPEIKQKVNRERISKPLIMNSDILKIEKENPLN
jgi:hypothetical protein